MFSISNTTPPRTSQLNPTEKSQTTVAPEVRLEAGSEKKRGTSWCALVCVAICRFKSKQLLTLNGDRPTLETMNEKINERVLTRQHVEGALKV